MVPPVSLLTLLCRQGEPGCGCWAEAAEGCGWNTGARHQQDQGIFLGSHFPAHTLWVLCTSVISTGSRNVNALLILKMGQCGRDTFLLYLPTWRRLFIALIVKGRKLKGFIKLSWSVHSQMWPLPLRFGLCVLSALWWLSRTHYIYAFSM